MQNDNSMEDINENKANSSQIQAFKEYDFDSNSKFKKYIMGIYPEPKGLLLRKYKRKFFKIEVDPDFDINFDDLNKKVPFCFKFYLEKTFLLDFVFIIR